MIKKTKIIVMKSGFGICRKSNFYLLSNTNFEYFYYCKFENKLEAIFSD